MILRKVPSDVTWECEYMSLVYLVSVPSCDPSTKVGAIVAFPNRSFVSGFNGCPSKVSNWLLDTDDKYSVVRHAEENALDFAGINRCQEQRPDLYVPFHPCPRCLGKLIHFRIKRVIYHTEYRSSVNDDRLFNLILQNTEKEFRPDIIKYDEKTYGKLLFQHRHFGMKRKA